MQVNHNSETIRSPKVVSNILRTVLKSESKEDQMKEHFWAIGLDPANRIQYIELVTLGTLNASLVHPREIFRMAILKSCAGIIIAHNHPSGEAIPSAEDNAITSQIKNASEILGIPLLDHVIVTKNVSYFSFAEKGIL